jgi:hypothetical protein
MLWMLQVVNVECVVQEKFYKVLKKNHDLETIKIIGKVISGEIVDDLQIPTLISLYKFVPLTSCDVERSFSANKLIPKISENQIPTSKFPSTMAINSFTI